MKINLWIVGLVLVVIASFGYAYAASGANSMAWVVSTIIMIIGGLVLIKSYFDYHHLTGKKR